MAAENQRLSDEEGELLTSEKESTHDFPSTGRFHFRLRTFVLLLLGVALLGWFVPLLIIHSKDNDSEFDETVMRMALALVALGFMCDYCHRFSRCPKCGKYKLGREGNYFINHIKLMFSLTGEQNHWEICRNCGYAEHREVSVS